MDDDHNFFHTSPVYAFPRWDHRTFRNTAKYFRINQNWICDEKYFAWVWISQRFCRFLQIKLSNFQKNNIAKLHPKIQHSSYHDVVPLHFRLLLNQFFTLQLQAEKRKNTVKTNLLFPNCYYARCTSILEVALSVCLS